MQSFVWWLTLWGFLEILQHERIQLVDIFQFWGNWAIQIQFGPKLNWSFLAFVQENSWDNGNSYLNELSKESIGIQYNCDFHLHHELVDKRQMLLEFESFHDNRSAHNVSWYEKSNFLPAPHLIWYINSQIPGKGLLIVLKESNKGRRKFLFLYPLPEKTLGPMPNKVDVIKFLQSIMTWYMNLWLSVTLCSRPRGL